MAPPIPTASPGGVTKPRTPSCQNLPDDEGLAKAKFAAILDDGLAALKSYLVLEFDHQFGSPRVSLTPRGTLRGAGLTPREATNESWGPRSSLCDAPVYIGVDQSDFVPTLDDAFLTPLDRWERFGQLLMQPKTLSKHGKIYHMHECWATYFRMLVHNEGNCQKGFEAAIQRTKKGDRSRRTISVDSLGRAFSSNPYFCVNPDSHFVRFWVVMVSIVLCCDTFLLPIKAFFDVEDSQLFKVAMWFTSIFWAVDVIINFRSGRYMDVLRLLHHRQCDRRCLRSRLFFDVILVLIDWSVLVIYEVAKDRPLGSVGVLLRSLRILRLVRLFRLLRLQFLIRDALQIDNKSIIAFSGVLKATLIYTIYVHFLACGWHAIGRADDSGWGHSCEVNSMPVVHCYATALHWALTQTHGTTNLVHKTTVEIIFASCAVFAGLFQFAFLLGKIVDATAQVMGAKKLELRHRCASFAARHSLSPNVTVRVMRFVDAREIEVHLDRVVQHDDELLSRLPTSLQTEVLEEMRRPLLGISILRDLRCVSSRLMTQLCCEAITSHIIASSEVVFSVGDQGTHWRIVDTGTLHYLKKGDDTWEKVLRALRERDDDVKDFLLSSVNNASHEDSFVNSSCHVAPTSSIGTTVTQETEGFLTTHIAKSLTRGSAISEMVLWTPWVHTGDLIAESDCVLLRLNLEAFHFVVKARLDTCLLTARYAQQYSKQLTQHGGSISDLFEYAESLGDDGYAEYNSENATQHLIFLSHFKEEAGTEATLMQVGLQAAIDDGGYDLEISNVFLDSEHLTDLSGLQEHVVNSKNLVLLLTPGVLHRPWCLIEIVTAIINDVQIVPVEIQRPGIKFVYPDEAFYTRLRDGSDLSQKDIKLLSGEGISVDDVEDALRFVFTQIALPFSPHKSKNVRDAELGDIMKRCAPKDGPGHAASRARVSGRQLASMSSNVGQFGHDRSLSMGIALT